MLVVGPLKWNRKASVVERQMTVLRIMLPSAGRTVLPIVSCGGLWMMFWRYIFSGPFDGPENEPQPFFGEPVIVI